MTYAAPVLRLQAAHYHAVRARLWPPRPRIVWSAPKREWHKPEVTEIYTSQDRQIAALLIAAARLDYVTPNRIIALASIIFELPVADIIGCRRLLKHVVPRQITMVVCRRMLKGSRRGYVCALGRAFGKDHTTVLYAIEKYGAMVERVHRQITAGAA